MAGGNTTIFDLQLNGSPAIATINRVAAHAQKRFDTLAFKADPFKGLNQSAQQFDRTLQHVSDRFLSYAAATQIVYGTANALQELAKAAVGTEKAIAQIQVNVKATQKEMSALSAGLFEVANKTSQSFFVAADAAAEFGRQGLKLNQVLDATHAALVLTQTTGIAVEDSVRALTVAVNTFQKEGLEYADIVNKMAEADTNFAVSSKDLVEFISRVGSTATDANVSFEETLSLATSLRQITGRTGSVLGNSMKSILTRLQRGGVRGALEDIGIKTTNSDGSFRNQISVLKDVANAYDGLSDAQQSYISEQVGGVYQINVVKALFSDIGREAGVYSNTLKIVSRESDAAFEKSAFLTDTAAGSFQTLRNEAVKLSQAIGNLGLVDALKDLSSGSGSGLSLFTNILTPEEGQGMGKNLAQGMIKGIIDVLSGPGLAVAAIAVSKLSKKIFGQLGSDVVSQFTKQQQNALNSNIKANMDRNAGVRALVNQERMVVQEIIRGNDALRQRVALLNSQIGRGSIFSQAVQLQGPRAFTGRGRARAAGYDPLTDEVNMIKRGVGGAKPNSKPVPVVINTAKGKENVIANSSEYILRNYLGSGKDAIFNQDMVSQIGGSSKLSRLGTVERLSASSSITGSFASGYASKTVPELVKIMTTGGHIQVAGAKKELAKRRINNVPFFNSPQALKYKGIGSHHLSDTGLARAAQIYQNNDLRMSGFRKEAARRGLANDPRVLGLNPSLASRSLVENVAYSPISGNNKRTNAQKAARSELAKMRLVEREENTRIRRLKKEAEVRAEKVKMQRQESILEKRLATDRARADASEKFNRFLQNNPRASKKQVLAQAKTIQGKYGVPLERDEIRSGYKGAAAVRRENFTSKALRLSFIAPMVANMADQALGAESGSAGIVRGASTGAAMGSFFGPWGMAGGAAIGGTMGVANMAKQLSSSFSDLKQKVDSSTVSLEASENTLNNFNIATDRLERLLRDPDARESDIVRITQEKNRLIADAPGALKNILQIPDAQGRTRAAQDYFNEEGSKLSVDTTMAALSKRILDKNGSFGVLFREMTGGPDFKIDSDENFRALAKSVVNSIDLKQLTQQSKKSGLEGVEARMTLDAINSQNMFEAMKGLASMGKINEDEFWKFYSKEGKSIEADPQAMINLSLAFRDALANQKAANELGERETQKRKEQLILSRGLKDSLNSISKLSRLRDTKTALTSRATQGGLSLLTMQPGLNSTLSNVFSGASNLMGLNSQKDSLVNSTTESIQGWLEDFYSDVDVIKRSKLPSSFQSSILSSLTSGNIGAAFDEISNGIKAIGGVDKSLEDKITKLNESFSQQNQILNLDIELQRQQLQAVLSIERKTKFDELIKSAMDTSGGITDSLDDQSFNEARRSFFRPSRDEITKVAASRRDDLKTQDTESLLDRMGDRAFAASKLLELDAQKKAAGERGLSPEEMAIAQSSALGYRRASSFNSSVGFAMQNMDGDVMAKNILQKANFGVAAGGGSIESIQGALGQLKGVRGRVQDPASKKAQALDDLISNLQGDINYTRSTTKDASVLASKVQGLTGQSGMEGKTKIIDEILNSVRLGDVSGVQKGILGLGKGMSATDFSGLMDKSGIAQAFVDFKKLTNDEEAGLNSYSSRRKSGLLDSEAIQGFNTVMSANTVATEALTTKIEELARKNDALSLAAKGRGYISGLDAEKAAVRSQMSKIESSVSGAPLTEDEVVGLRSREQAVSRGLSGAAELFNLEGIGDKGLRDRMIEYAGALSKGEAYGSDKEERQLLKEVKKKLNDFKKDTPYGSFNPFKTVQTQIANSSLTGLTQADLTFSKLRNRGDLGGQATVTERLNNNEEYQQLLERLDRLNNETNRNLEIIIKIEEDLVDDNGELASIIKTEVEKHYQKKTGLAKFSRGAADNIS